jgi:hypothetical protein
MPIYPIHVTYTIRFFLLNLTPQIINNEVPRHVIFSTLLLLSLSLTPTYNRFVTAGGTVAFDMYTAR